MFLHSFTVKVSRSGEVAVFLTMEWVRETAFLHPAGGCLSGHAAKNTRSFMIKFMNFCTPVFYLYEPP